MTKIKVSYWANKPIKKVIKVKMKDGKEVTFYHKSVEAKKRHKEELK